MVVAFSAAGQGYRGNRGRQEEAKMQKQAIRLDWGGFRRGAPVPARSTREPAMPPAVSRLTWVFFLAAIVLATAPAAAAEPGVSTAFKSCRERCYARCDKSLVMESQSDVAKKDCITKCALFCNSQGVKPVGHGRTTSPSPADPTRRSVVAESGRRKVRDHRRRQVDHRKHRITAPKGHRWVQRPDGSLVAVPERGTALIRQGFTMKCGCRETRADHCTVTIDSGGDVAKCFADSTGCKGGAKCTWKTGPGARQLRTPQTPRAVR